MPNRVHRHRARLRLALALERDTLFLPCCWETTLYLYIYFRNTSQLHRSLSGVSEFHVLLNTVLMIIVRSITQALNTQSSMPLSWHLVSRHTHRT